jgi:hypothetical protein
MLFYIYLSYTHKTKATDRTCLHRTMTRAANPNDLGPLKTTNALCAHVGCKE